MPGIKITAPPSKIFKEEIRLPFSKSESNRALIINALSGFKCDIENLSDADDTVLMAELLQSSSGTIDCKNAGTVLRFLTAYYCVTGQQKIITGSGRMCMRPIAPLVKALNELGADITYMGEEGFPPVKVIPSALTGKKQIELNAGVSSQFISALLMIGPLLKDGLEIRLKGEVSSMPYIHMTAGMMSAAGIEVKQSGRKISVKNQSYQPCNLKINGDWSSAAFIYEIAALSESSEISVANIFQGSRQGDEKVTEIFKSFGVETGFKDKRLIVKKKKTTRPDYFSFDFIHFPDLALPVAATCGALNVVADLHGLKNLVIKESNRAYAFQREAYKLNIKTDFCDHSKLKILERSQIKHTQKILNTYNDHRLAMTFAPLSILTNEIFLDDDASVAKSFPGFWNCLGSLQFKVALNPVS